VQSRFPENGRTFQANLLKFLLGVRASDATCPGNEFKLVTPSLDCSEPDDEGTARTGEPSDHTAIKAPGKALHRLKVAQGLETRFPTKCGGGVEPGGEKKWM